MTNKYCHAELDSASTLYTVHRFRNEFGMTLRNELFGHPHILDSVHMVFPSCEFVFTMENPVVVVAVENQAVISLPAVRMNRRAFKHKARVL